MSLAILFHFLCTQHVLDINISITRSLRLVMDIFMSKTCWVHKKWNKIASDIKLVFYSLTITMMHGPINTKPAFIVSCYNKTSFYCKLLHMFWRNQVQPITVLPWRVSSQWVYLVSVSRTYCCDVAILDVGTETVSIKLPSKLLVSVNLHPGRPLQHKWKEAYHNNSSS